MTKLESICLMQHFQICRQVKGEEIREVIIQRQMLFPVQMDPTELLNFL